MDKKRFQLKEEHVKLLQGCYIEWNECEYGAPCIDPKRPYGNSGRHKILLDMGEILGIEPIKWDDEERYTQEQELWLEELHFELKDALQIIISCKTFEPGMYEADEYSNNWKLIG